MKTVSIVVPVYKIREEYLRQCIESLRKQTLEDIEIILVDDGSPDSCGKICDAYAKEDKRIQVIHQKNQGVSVARNAGMDIAQGKWLTFVDADDWLERTALERLVNEAERFNVEVLYCGAYQEWENHREEGHMPFAEETLLQEEEISMLHSYIFAPQTFFSAGVTWGKLYLRAALDGYRFSPGYALGQDVVFAIPVLMHMRRIAYIDACLYHYRMRAASADSRYREDRAVQLTKTAHRLYALLQEEKAKTETWDTYFAWVYEKVKDFILRQYFHPSCSFTYKQRVKACKNLFSQHPYAEALERADVDGLRQRAGLFLLRKRMYGCYAVLFRGWTRFCAWRKGEAKERICFD